MLRFPTLAGAGDGIAKIDGFVIFVSGAKQGQQARIKVTQVSNRYAMGTLVEGSSSTSTTGGSQQQQYEQQQASGSAEQEESTEEQA